MENGFDTAVSFFFSDFLINERDRGRGIFEVLDSCRVAFNGSVVANRWLVDFRSLKKELGLIASL